MVTQWVSLIDNILESLFALLGLSMGDWIGFPRIIEFTSRTFIFPAVLNLVVVALLGAGTLLGDALEERYRWLVLGGYIVFGICFVMNLFPLGNKNGYLYAWKALTEHNQMLSLSTVGPISPVSCCGISYLIFSSHTFT